MDNTQYENALQQAFTQVFAWLFAHCSFYPARYNHDERLAEFIAFVAALATPKDSEQRTRFAAQHLLLFLVHQGDEVVAAGFRQSSGKNNALHMFGVRDDMHRFGIATKALAWFISGLPAAAAAGKSQLGVHRDNLGINRWAEKVGATEIGADKTYSDAEEVDLSEIRFLELSTAKACERLGIDPPSNDGFNFPAEYEGLTFQILYFGKHPAHLAPGEEPIVQQM